MEETKYPMLREASNDIWGILLSRGSRLLPNTYLGVSITTLLGF